MTQLSKVNETKNIFKIMQPKKRQTQGPTRLYELFL